MKKRIFLSMLLLAIISLLMASIALGAVFYWQISSSAQKEVRERAFIIKDTLASGDYASLTIADMRLTVVAPSGIVLYDDDQDASLLPSHADREEIKEANIFGWGESRRFSDTLGEETYYFAIQLEDQSILRLAKTTNSIWGMFVRALPVIVFVVLVISGFGYFLTGKLTKRIVDPINSIDMEAMLCAPYDELVPFVQTILRQREHIAQQMTDMKDRADTMAAIMDSMNEGLILVNAKGNILSINQSVISIFGIDHEVVGKNILEALRDAEINEHMRLAISGSRSELIFLRNDLTYRAYFSPVTDRGAVILFLDVTEKTIAEKQRREFSANVSHELKTPLTTIYGNVEMLENDMIKEEDRKQFYQKIRDEATRLIALIEDIMLLSQLDEENKLVMLENVDLVAVAYTVIESLTMAAKAREIEICVSGGGTLFANRSQMMELFYNLIHNAIKYNKPKGTVKVEINQEENKTDIILSDTGIGIPIEAQSRIFERFYRVDQSRSKKTGGTGLGLAIVKHIVAAYHGNVEVQSTVGKGTIITVTLYAQ